MIKKPTYEEQKKLAQEFIEATANIDFSIIEPSKKSIKSSKTPLEKLKKYIILVDESVFWASRQSYLKLIQNFLSKKIDGETFTREFSKLRTQNMISVDELCTIIENGIRPIPDLHYTSKATDFSSAIDELYLEIDRYSPNIPDDEQSDSNGLVYNQSELRLVIQKNFVPILQKSCDLNDSFF